MILSSCLCSNKPVNFISYIQYKNETVFKDFEGIVIGKCQNCGVLKTFPPKRSDFDPLQSRKNMYEYQRSYFVKLFLPIVQKIQKYKSSGKVLDVGCSSGLLLELLQKKNYKVCGIEPNKQAFDIVKRKFGSKIHNGTLSSFRKKNVMKFDIVIYNHVLEHIEDIKTEIFLIKKILKKDGIFVLGLPNTSNCIFYLRKKYWEPLMPLEHVWHFSKNYLMSFLYKNSFTVSDVSFSDDSRNDYPLLKRLYFSVLSFFNRLFYTGEAMLLISKKIS